MSVEKNNEKKKRKHAQSNLSEKCENEWHRFAIKWIFVSPWNPIPSVIPWAHLPFIFAKIGFGLLNTIGHRTPNGANVPWLNFFIAGEGYHRNHHENMKRVRLHKWDIGGWIAEKLFLDYEKNNYLFMVADPSNRGYHLFASNLSEHNKNRRAYIRWINSRGIYRWN